MVEVLKTIITTTNEAEALRMVINYIFLSKEQIVFANISGKRHFST